MAPVLGLVAPAWRAFRRWKRKTSSKNIRRGVAVAKVGGAVLALGREGALAGASPNPGRRRFAAWVERWSGLSSERLQEGEWMAGEWLALAHSTRYRLTHEPFVPFELFARAGASAPRPAALDALEERLRGSGLCVPHVVHRGGAIGIADALAGLGTYGAHGAVDPVEGAVWRIERAGFVVGRAKYVRPGKVDGALLPESSGGEPIWNA